MSKTAENPTTQPPTPSPTPAPRRSGSGSVQPVGRRTRVVVRKVGPLSVLKFSLLFYLCVMLIVYFALMIIYWLLSAVGAIDSAGRLLGYVFATGNAGETQAVEIKFGSVFGWLLLIGLGNVIIWSLVNVFVAFLYNLISDVVGGVEVTLAQKR
jgi:transmembrane protein DUF3566